MIILETTLTKAVDEISIFFQEQINFRSIKEIC